MNSKTKYNITSVNFSLFVCKYSIIVQTLRCIVANFRTLKCAHARSAVGRDLASQVNARFSQRSFLSETTFFVKGNFELCFFGQFTTRQRVTAAVIPRNPSVSRGEGCPSTPHNPLASGAMDGGRGARDEGVGGWEEGREGGEGLPWL